MVSSMHFKGCFPNFTAPRGDIHSEAVMPWHCCPCGVPCCCSAGDWGCGGVPAHGRSGAGGISSPFWPKPLCNFVIHQSLLQLLSAVSRIQPLRYLQCVWRLLPVYLESECVWYFWRTWREACMLHPKLLFNEAGSRALNGEGIHTEHKYIWCVRGFWTLCGSTS